MSSAREKRREKLYTSALNSSESSSVIRKDYEKVYGRKPKTRAHAPSPSRWENAQPETYSGSPISRANDLNYRYTSSNVVRGELPSVHSPSRLTQIRINTARNGDTFANIYGVKRDNVPFPKSATSVLESDSRTRETSSGRLVESSRSRLAKLDIKHNIPPLYPHNSKAQSAIEPRPPLSLSQRSPSHFSRRRASLTRPASNERMEVSVTSTPTERREYPKNIVLPPATPSSPAMRSDPKARTGTPKSDRSSSVHPEIKELLLKGSFQREVQLLPRDSTATRRLSRNKSTFANLGNTVY